MKLDSGQARLAVYFWQAKSLARVVMRSVGIDGPPHIALFLYVDTCISEVALKNMANMESSVTYYYQDLSDDSLFIRDEVHSLDERVIVKLMMWL